MISTFLLLYLLISIVPILSKLVYLLLNTHDRTTLRCNHEIFYHDFITALDDDDDDEGQLINYLSEHIGFLHFFLCRNKKNQVCSSDQSIS